MDFCNNCGSLMYLFNEKGIAKSYCKKCNISKETISGSFKEQHSQKEIGKGIGSEENKLANYDNVCKKCRHIGAQIIDVGVLISDEDNLIMLKCGKCGFTERLGRKVT